MAIALSILKIIGIVLLVLVCVILFLVIFLLIMPIRYKLKATYLEKDVNAVATVTYFWPIVRAKAIFNKNDGFQTKIKILWFSLLDNNESENKKQKANTSEKEKSSKKKSKKEKPVTQTSVQSKDTPPNKANTIHITKGSATNTKTEPKTTNQFHNVKHSKNNNKFNLSQIGEKIKKKYNEFVKKIKRLYQSFEKTKDKAKWYKKLYDTETTQYTIAYLKKQLGWILKMYRPRKIKGYLYFGFSDPALTGEALGVLAMSYPWLGKHVSIIPNFEETCFEEDIYITGYVQLYIIVLTVIKLYFNKKVRVTWKRFNKIKGGN